MPLFQASHGFAASSKWADGIGAFINLESTGNGGPDVLFQHTAHWTVDTWAKHAAVPRGNVIGQVSSTCECTLSRTSQQRQRAQPQQTL